jgi:hypothetical protein
MLQLDNESPAAMSNQKTNTKTEWSSHGVEASTRYKGECSFPISGRSVGSRKPSHSSVSQRSNVTGTGNMGVEIEENCLSGRRRDSESTSARIRSASSHFIMGLTSIGTRARVYESAVAAADHDSEIRLHGVNTDTEFYHTRAKDSTLATDDGSLGKIRNVRSDGSLDSLAHQGRCQGEEGSENRTVEDIALHGAHTTEHQNRTEGGEEDEEREEKD